MKKKKLKFNLYNFIIRYLILVLIAIPNLWIFYTIFTPLTVYPVYLISKIFFNVSLSNNVLLINGLIPVDLIKACIAGSAYYLLLILNLSVPNFNIKERIKMISFSFLSLLFFNIIRIIILISLYLARSSSFELIHEFFWYGLSIVFVLFIWFLEVKIYKIKEIPVYSDIKSLRGFIKK
jgi:exosortase/archaeosortase family protein